MVVGYLCCRRRDNSNMASPGRDKKGYQKGTLSQFFNFRLFLVCFAATAGNQAVKPPDLWIHHDRMELKNMEKRHSTNDGASSSGALTLPRSVGGNEYDTHDSVHTNSLDKRTYVPNYGKFNLKMYYCCKIEGC